MQCEITHIDRNMISRLYFVIFSKGFFWNFKRHRLDCRHCSIVMRCWLNNVSLFCSCAEDASLSWRNVREILDTDSWDIVEYSKIYQSLIQHSLKKITAYKMQLKERYHNQIQI